MSVPLVAPMAVPVVGKAAPKVELVPPPPPPEDDTSNLPVAGSAARGTTVPSLFSESADRSGARLEPNG